MGVIIIDKGGDGGDIIGKIDLLVSKKGVKMKKYYRLVSVFVLFMFLFNGVVLDSSKSFGMGEKSTLSPVLKFSPLAGIEPKEMVRVEFSLESALLDFAEGEKEIDVEKLIEWTNDFYGHSSVFDNTHLFFAEKEVLDNNRVKVMARVIRRGGNSETVLRTYYAVFSTKKENGGFNVDSYTEEEWTENERIIRRGGELPKRKAQSPKDAQAMERYKNDNEKGIDKFIRDRIFDNDFAEIEGRTAEDLWSETLTQGMKKPTVKFPSEYMQYINQQLNGFLKNFGTNVETALYDKNLVFIRVPEGVDYPIIYEKDPVSGEMVPIPVRSHTSQKAVYIFLDNYTFDSLKDPKVRWDLVVKDSILPHLLYEIGVIYGLPYRVVDRIRTTNDFLAAKFMHTGGMSIKEVKQKFPNLKLKQKVNLNKNLRTRDYAMGDRSERVQTDANLEVLAKAIAEEFYKEPDKKKRELIFNEVERKLAIYSLKAIIWHLMAQNGLTEPTQLDSVEIKKEKLWQQYTTISLNMDKVLRTDIIKWINTQAMTTDSALLKEVKSATIVQKGYSGQSTLCLSDEQEKKIVDLVQKPTLKELFGHKYPADFMYTENFTDKINSHLKETEKADKGPYWYAVEEDLRKLVEEGKVAKITESGQIVNVKTEKEIDTPEGEKIKTLIGAIKNQVGSIRNDCENKNYFDGFGNQKIRDWGKNKYLAITKQEVAPSSWFYDATGKKLIQYVQGLFAPAQKMEVYIVLKSTYVSPRTKEFVHVGRAANRIWFGEDFLIEASKRAQEDSDSLKRILDVMSRLFIDEEQHVGKSGVNHGGIEKEKDIGEVVDHMMRPEDKAFLSDMTRSAWEESMKGKMPWEPLLEGGTVGQSPKFVEFFEGLKEFAGNDMMRTAIVFGADGNGKTKVVDAVSDMMKTGRNRAVRIDCRTFALLKEDKAYEILFGRGDEQPGAIGKALKAENGLLVIDNFHKLSKGTPQWKMVKSILRDVKRGDSISSSVAEELDTKRLKVLCLANSDKYGPKYGLKSFKTSLESDKIWEELQTDLDLPLLFSRENDVLRMAEYFNFEASKRRQIDYAPIDEMVGSEIKEAMRKSYAITLWDIKHLIETIVANRKRKAARYSDYLITYADIHEIEESVQKKLPKLKGLWDFEKVDKIEMYYDKQKELLPYFKELASGKDENGNPIGFYKGKRGEQPGLPRGGRGFPSYPKHPGLFKHVARLTDEDVQQKKKLETLTEYANKVGKLIAPPVSHYTLFTAYDLATDEEYDEDIKSYRSRFNIERISTDKPEDIVVKVLDVIDEKGLQGEDIIIQLPKEFSEKEYGVFDLLEVVPGIKFMVIDTKGLKEEPERQDRKKYRATIYSMMCLARNINKNSSPMVSGLLNRFVDYCFDNTMDSSRRDKLIESYLTALSLNKVTDIVNIVLSYEYMKKVTLPEKALIIKTLLSA